MRFPVLYSLAALIVLCALVSASEGKAQSVKDADNLGAQVDLLMEAGKFSEAIPIAERQIALLEKSSGPARLKLAVALRSLAQIFGNLNRVAEAEPLFKRSLYIQESALGPSVPSIAETLGDLALLYRAQVRFNDAEQLYKRILFIYDSQPKRIPDPYLPAKAAALNSLGDMYRVQGRFAEAEPLLKQSLKLYEDGFGPDSSRVATALNDLALVLLGWGRYSDAESLMKRSLEISDNRQKAGRKADDFAISLNNLAELYVLQDRFAEAEPLFKRAMDIWDKMEGGGQVHPNYAHFAGALGELYAAQGRYLEAESMLEMSLAIRETALEANHPDIGLSMHNLAELNRILGRLSIAEARLRKSIEIRERAFGANHPEVARSLNSLGDVYKELGQFEAANEAYNRALAVRESVNGVDHPSVGISYSNLAMVALAQGDWTNAAERFRKSSLVHRGRAARGRADTSLPKKQSGGVPHSLSPFSALVKVTHKIATINASIGDGPSRETFEIAQWVQSPEAAASLAQMAARGANGSRELSRLVRERQDLAAEWQAKDKLIIAARSEPPARRYALEEKLLSDRISAIETRMLDIDKRLKAEFAEYFAISSPQPLLVEKVQADLLEDEALLLFMDTASLGPMPEETFIWIVTKSNIRWFRSDLGTSAIEREVAALRCGLDATAWTGEGARRCSDLLKFSLEKAPTEGEPLPFDTARAHALYIGLLGEAADLIKGKHLLVVPSGALTTLPFHVLVTERPRSSDLADARWLIRDHAISVLPSVASLAALRRSGKPSAAARPMIGFGNPLLDGNQAHPQHGGWYREQAALARARTGCAKTDETRSTALRRVTRALEAGPLMGGRLADLAHLKAQSPLPETADELCYVARSVGSVEDVRIATRATESEVKRLNAAGELARYRILHFATHGTLAGQLSGTTEPGLILTPPATATANDDGYLSGSEIASLKLDADWVILSACNTAGGAGQGESAEALSGLARVFFYAGTRALLVSHWEVDSAAAVKLVTAAIGALAKDPSIGRAEALRRATFAAMADTTRPATWVPAWHPAVWAPFVVVGEGGVGR